MDENGDIIDYDALGKDFIWAFEDMTMKSNDITKVDLAKSNVESANYDKTDDGETGGETTTTTSSTCNPTIID